MEEIIKAMGWPQLTFLFAVFFVLVFKKPLLGLISRITSIDKSGIKASQTTEAQSEKQKKESVQELLLAIGDSIVLQDIEGRIKADLKEKGLETEGDTIRVLIKHLAGTRMFLEFEQLHDIIFGSQIILLKKLNEAAGQGKPIEFVATHFENVKGLFAKQLSDWSLEQYLAFLVRSSLITTKGKVTHITNLGVEYLIWMIRNGKREDKPL